MANIGSLKPFKKGNDERRNVTGANLGSKHRSTIVRKWLEIETEEINPLTMELEKLSQEDFITLQQIKEAKGLTDAFTGPAYKNIMDSAYGAPKQEVDLSGEVGLIWNEVKTYPNDPNAKNE